MSKRPERPIVCRSAPDLREGPQLARAKILVVEDSPLLAVNIEDALVDAGFQVVGIAASGAQALALAQAHRPELAVMDIRLAGTLDGVDVAIAIRERFGTWCVFASAHGAPDLKARGQQANPAGWLTKPFTMSQLVQVVSGALVQKRAS